MKYANIFTKIDKIYFPPPQKTPINNKGVRRIEHPIFPQKSYTLKTTT